MSEIHWRFNKISAGFPPSKRKKKIKPFRKKVLDRILKVFSKSVRRFWYRARIRKKLAELGPLRGELFSFSQMEQHARNLSVQHCTIKGQGRGRQLYARLMKNRGGIHRTSAQILSASHQKARIASAGEYLLDNFHFIETQIQKAQADFPRDCADALPILVRGKRRGGFRIYALASFIVAHSDARLGLDEIRSFLRCYQERNPLKIDELWSVPVMLRLALIENICGMAARISADTRSRVCAAHWADRMIKTLEKDPSDLIRAVNELARSETILEDAFVVEFTRRLRGYGHLLDLPIAWVEQKLSQMGDNADRLLRADVYQQTIDHVIMSNCVMSLRLINDTDWTQFVEDMSLVSHVLAQDPARIYRQMDFTTRSLYLEAVKTIAVRASCSEEDVARRALDLSSLSFAAGKNRESHVGYFLIDKGRSVLERDLGIHPSIFERFHAGIRKHSLLIYLGTILGLTLIPVGVMLSIGMFDGLPLWVAPLMVCFSLVANSHPALALTNWAVSVFTRPRPIPRLDFSNGIPDDARTIVVNSTLLLSRAHIDTLCRQIEIHFLANRDPNLLFCLVTDFVDASAETLPDDSDLLDYARTSIESLNKMYAPNGAGPFFLFHRSRRWNEMQGCWMGYERKRGKLDALNALLRGAAPESPKNDFSLTVGDLSALRSVRNVITMDDDTELPGGAAQQMVAAMAHPLNRAVFDEKMDRVIQGYGILQPRLDITLPSLTESFYARMFGDEPGIDPYTRYVSNVYQDAFDEGSFVGKGIYDIEVFDRAFRGRFPENRILSHDMIEGCYVRSGLLNDVVLYEKTPPRYDMDLRRRHRWIRGDWQIAAWIFPVVPLAGGRRGINPLSPLSRWKIFDNLRRSLVPGSLMLLLIAGWLLSNQPWSWTLWTGTVLVFPSLWIVVTSFFTRAGREVSFRSYFEEVLSIALRQSSQTLFSLATLTHEFLFSVDAIFCTLWRVYVTGRYGLVWTASVVTNSAKNDTTPSPYYVRMWVSPAIAFFVFLGVFWIAPAAFVPAAPFLVFWGLGPAAIWFVNRPACSQVCRSISPRQQEVLGRVARKTWAFFETYVGPEDHYLPPDNIQESPVAVIAHRTSPTNIGMSLLANLAAEDFGYITTSVVIDRVEKTLATMARMERYRGHFYNWYDTHTLSPLLPIYISTVDSGNLSVYLLTLRAGLLDLASLPALPPRWPEGLRDTFALLRDNKDAPVQSFLADFETALDRVLIERPTTISSCSESLRTLKELSNRLLRVFASEQMDDAAWWAEALDRQCGNLVTEFNLFFPWAQDSQAQEWCRRYSWLNDIPTLEALGEITDRLVDDVDSSLQNHLNAAALCARSKIRLLSNLAVQAGEMAEMDYRFLYDETRRMLTIGYNLTERRRDNHHYDLLASEARQSIFLAIAQGQIPRETWLALGRQITGGGHPPALLSWSGSMFEYLMPTLVMPSPENTLLDRTCRAAVQHQINHGLRNKLPWGFSESCYFIFDAILNYQYRAFGAPSLRIKNETGNDLVVAPYASVMALMVAPQESFRNLVTLSSRGYEGRFGFFEAIDYTPARMPPGRTEAVVQSYLTHHQGMSLLSLAYVLLDRPMQRRFESIPMFRANLSLLYERFPKLRSSHKKSGYLRHHVVSSSTSETPPVRVLTDLASPVPEVNLLSNGQYHVMVTDSGGGYTRWKDLAITRWHEDTTRDSSGSFCYIRDVSTGSFWSTAYQPTLKKPDSYEVIFSEGKAEYRRYDDDIATATEIIVSPEDNLELRRVHLTNHSRKKRNIEITTYAEVVIAPPDSDASHPNFSNLFVQTEIQSSLRAILCTRRPRDDKESFPVVFHQMISHGAKVQHISYETDRSRFIGRGNNLVEPAAMRSLVSLSNSQGVVLDPIVSIRSQVTLDPDESVTVDFITGVVETPEKFPPLVKKYADHVLINRMADIAWLHGQVALRQINVQSNDAQIYGRIAGSLIYANSALRAKESVLRENHLGIQALWSESISGDHPIVLLKIKDPGGMDLVFQMLQAHSYWRRKGLVVDLVIMDNEEIGYRHETQDQIYGLVAGGTEAHFIECPGGIFVRSSKKISPESCRLLEAVARVVISDENGSLTDQIDQLKNRGGRLPSLFSWDRSLSQHQDEVCLSLTESDLDLFNGIGGFVHGGQEYALLIRDGKLPPSPWVNVIANPNFGTVISDTGSSYSWGINSSAFRLTPWDNDPVISGGGEAIYLRDEVTGYVWSPTPAPIRGVSPYLVRHGFGYSVFEHVENGIRSELLIYVDSEKQIKYSVLKLHNQSGETRMVSATGYVEWVLGDRRSRTAMHVITEIEPQTGALLARNRYSAEFPNCTAFFDVDDSARSVTGDRGEFLGRNGSPRDPEALKAPRLSGRVGAGMDPCGAIQVTLTLADEEEREVIFRLGMVQQEQASDSKGGGDRLRGVIRACRGSLSARAALDKVRQFWSDTLGVVQVETGHTAIDALANGWLLYQTLSSRFWARTGFYQSSGAFGFRDQLQDSMALVHAQPAFVREHLLMCARHQFREGDVQHWWHPHSGRGVRTKCSDDYLWLPFAVCRYVSVTGDIRVLDEVEPFLEGRPLMEGEESYYDLPAQALDEGTLYEHCVRAITHGLRFGVHGLPLIGSCDWNDAMNKVGEKGRGESVWLAFFTFGLLHSFAELSERRGDLHFADRCRVEAEVLRQSIETSAWDGKWYRRAYFDDGTPLGSSENSECQIDSLAQSWAVLSGAADSIRARQAMVAVDERLVSRGERLVRLFDPPFDRAEPHPGYIRGYLPGVRENGGQYTHAAIWTVMAFAQLGDANKAWEILNLLIPAYHAQTVEQVGCYRVEPYVVAADVYGSAPHVGRGGWTWYTGSAGWMYRLILETVLGLDIRDNQLTLSPNLPDGWSSFRLKYRFRSTSYDITVVRGDPENDILWFLDGLPLEGDALPLVDDGVCHFLEARVPSGHSRKR